MNAQKKMFFPPFLHKNGVMSTDSFDSTKRVITKTEQSERGLTF